MKVSETTKKPVLIYLLPCFQEWQLKQITFIVQWHYKSNYKIGYFRNGGGWVTKKKVTGVIEVQLIPSTGDGGTKPLENMLEEVPEQQRQPHPHSVLQHC